MIDFKDKVAERLQRCTQLQKDALASMQASGAIAVETYEKLARHNLDVAADVVGFTVDQAKAAAGASDAKALLAKQIDTVSAFAEALEAHGKAFVDLVGEAASNVSGNGGSAEATPAEPGARKSA